jgi:hypothetical protein
VWVAAIAALGCVAIGTSAAAASTSSVQAQATQYMKIPTTIGNFPSLKTKPPKRTVAYLATSEVSNVQVAAAVKQVAKIAGWNYVQISYDPSNPATFTQAVNTAITKHANYAMEAGTPLTPSILALAKSHHLKFALDAVYYGGFKVAPPIIGSSDGYTQDHLMGALTADEFILDSHGNGKAVVEHIPSFPILDAFTDGFYATVKANCPKCQTTEVDVSIPDLLGGKLNGDVVAAMQRNPSYTYVVTDDGPFFETLPAALQQAGLSGKKILGEAGDAAGFQNLRTKTELAWTGYSVAFPAYEMMDAAFRDAEGMKVPKADSVQPTQLVTQANVGKISNNWNYPPNGLKQLEKVWHLG